MIADDFNLAVRLHADVTDLYAVRCGARLFNRS